MLLNTLPGHKKKVIAPFFSDAQIVKSNDAPKSYFLDEL